MTTNDEQTSRWTRGERWALALFVVGALASLIHFAHPFYDSLSDAACYVLTARSMLAGEGYSYLGQPFILRPPGFSVLLTPFLALFGTDFRVLNLVVALSGIACLACMFVLYRPRLGALPTLALCIAIWINPVWQRFSMQLMSDVPGAALMFLSLALERWHVRRPWLLRSVLLGLCIAAAGYVRTTNFLLLPALACARFAPHMLRRSQTPLWATARPLAVVLVIPILAYLPWTVRDRSVAPLLASEQLYVHSYSTAMWHTDPADPASPKVPLAEILHRAPERGLEMLQGVAGGLREEIPGSPRSMDLESAANRRSRDAPPETWALAIGAGLLAAVLGALAWRRAASEFLALGLVASLSFYPFELHSRHLLPLALLALGSLIDLARAGASRVLSDRWAQPLLLVLILIPAALSFDADNGRAELEREHLENKEACDWIAEHYPPDAALAAPLGGHYAVLSGRRIYSLQIAANRQSFPASLDILRRRQVVAVVLNKRTNMGSKYMQEFMRRRYALEQEFGDILVYKVGEGGSDDTAPATKPARPRDTDRFRVKRKGG